MLEKFVLWRSSGAMDEAQTTEPPQEENEPPPPLPNELVSLSTAVGLTYAVGEPYPNLPAELARAVEGTVTSILESPDESDATGRAYLVRVATPQLPDGYALVEKIGASAVVSAASRLTVEQLAAKEAADDANPAAGIDVRRVVQRVGGAIALVFEVGAQLPAAPGFPPWMAGRVETIYRTPEGPYRMRVLVGRSAIFPGGMTLELQLFDWISALEVLPAAELEAWENAARKDALEKLGDDDDDDDSDDDGADDDDDDEKGS